MGDAPDGRREIFLPREAFVRGDALRRYLIARLAAISMAGYDWELTEDVERLGWTLRVWPRG